MLVSNIYLFLYSKGLKAVPVLRYIRPSTVNTLLSPFKLRVISLSLKVYSSGIVSITRLILTEPSNMTKLVVTETVTSSHVYTVP